MSEKDFIVVFKEHDAQDEFYEQMETEGKTDENKFVPERQVQLVDRKETRKQTVYSLTEEEARHLNDDPRIKGVVLENDPNVISVPCANFPGTQSFNRTTNETNLNNEVDWAKLRCVRDTWDQSGSEYPTDLPLGYYSTGQWDGANTNVIVVDGTLDSDHPEFAVNRDGSGGSRMVQYDWFQNATTNQLNSHPTWQNGYSYSFGNNTSAANSNDDHGHHVAGTIAGNTHGWAPKARIFNLNPYSTNNNWVSFSHPLEFIINNINDIQGTNGWINSTHGDPTVINNSWILGYSVDFPFDVEFRGSIVPVPDINAAAAYGVPVYYDTNVEPYGWKGFLYKRNDVAMEDDIDELVSKGIIVVSAAGNDNVPVCTSYYADGSPDPDLMNRVIDGSFNFQGNFGWTPNASERYYAQGGSLNHHTPNITVGATSFETYGGTFYSDMKVYFSNKGSRIDLYAPGYAINAPTRFSGPQDDIRGAPTYKLDRKSGTSMSAPQVSGVIARIISRYRHYRYTDIKQYFVMSSQASVGSPDSDLQPELQRNTMGSHNRFLKHYPIRRRKGLIYPKVNSNHRQYSSATMGRAGMEDKGLRFPRVENIRPHLLS